MPAVASADVSVHVSDTPHLDFVRKNFKYTVVPFGELLANLAAEETDGGGGGGGGGGGDARGAGGDEKEKNEVGQCKLNSVYL
jgi:uncharacterized membrane protein